jgi:hypothetical protein
MAKKFILSALLQQDYGQPEKKFLTDFNFFEAVSLREKIFYVDFRFLRL